METSERLVLYYQMSDGDRFGDAVLGYLAIPFPHDLVPGETFVQLFQDNPHHDASAFERRLPTTDFRVGDDMSSQLDAPVLSICLRFHATESNYATRAAELQGLQVPQG